MKLAGFKYVSETGGEFRPAADVLDPDGSGRTVADLIAADPARYLVRFAGMTRKEAKEARRVEAGSMPDGPREVLLTNQAPALRYNLADDGFGNLRVVVPAGAWAAAFYHVHGWMV